MQLVLPTLADSRRLAQCVADSVSVPLAICLTGTLGSGKTQLTKFICEALGIPSSDVTSPTFVLVHRYIGQFVIYHIDLYRLESIDQVWDLGIDEMFAANCLTIIEWADKFQNYLPDDHLHLDLAVDEDGSRIARVAGYGIRGAEILTEIGRRWDLALNN